MEKERIEWLFCAECGEETEHILDEKRFVCLQHEGLEKEFDKPLEVW